jgi:hypothetical protein
MHPVQLEPVRIVAILAVFVVLGVIWPKRHLWLMPPACWLVTWLALWR